jgi:acylphosphatase
MERTRAIIQVGGTVQGVGFRWFVLRNAQQLGVTGWVKNLGNGDVLTVAEGAAEAVAELAEMLRHGPARAQVLHHSVERGEFTGEFGGFEVRGK